jgi:SAM-dependent methyltransferase
MRCNECGLGIVIPLPGNDVIESFYAPDYTCYNHVERSQWRQQIWWKIAKWQYGAVYRNSLGNRLLKVLAQTSCAVIGRVPPATMGLPLSLPVDSLILEIGFGSGDWLLRMRKCGYTHLAGVDIAANQDNCTKLLQHGINAYCGDITTKGTWPGTVECVRMEHVLEHVPEPESLLEHVARLLSPSGWLVLTVPDFDWWYESRKEAGLVCLDLPLHLYHYGRKSLSRLLTGAGLKVVCMESIRARNRFCLNFGDIRTQDLAEGSLSNDRQRDGQQASVRRCEEERYITVCARRDI